MILSQEVGKRGLVKFDFKMNLHFETFCLSTVWIYCYSLLFSQIRPHCENKGIIKAKLVEPIATIFIYFQVFPSPFIIYAIYFISSTIKWLLVSRYLLLCVLPVHIVFIIRVQPTETVDKASILYANYSMKRVVKSCKINKRTFRSSP